MALYQPTNITPDLKNGVENGVVFVAPGSNVAVSWTVNGNSPLLAYQIAFFKNDTASTAGTDTGKITLDEPFYPISADGTESRFSVQLPYGVGGTYFSIAATDANKQGKIRITQWWGSGNNQSVVQRSLSVFRITSKSSVSIVSQSGTGGVMRFVGEVTLPSFALYGESAVNWSRWQIFDAETGEVVQDTERVWGATDYQWTSGQLAPGTYYAALSVATSNGEELTATGAEFSVLQNGVLINGAVVAVCDKASGAVRVTAKATDDLEAVVTNGVSMVNDMVTFGDEAIWNLPVISNDGWGLLWRGNIYDEQMPVVKITMTNGNVLSFGRDPNTGKIAFSPAFPTTGAIPAGANDLESDLLVSIVTDGAGHIGQSVGVVTSNDYDWSDYEHQSFDWSAPAKVEIFSGCRTSELEIVFGSDGISALQDYAETSQPYYFGPRLELIPAITVSGSVVMRMKYFGDAGGGTIWRGESGSSSLTRITDFGYMGSGSDECVCLDYGAGNEKDYIYYVFYQRTNYGQPVIARSATVNPCFWNWMLIEAAKSEGNYQGDYYVVNTFFFGMNLSSGSNGNGNAPTIAENFTRYPTVFRDTQNRQSGTLAALIGSLTGPGVYADTNAVRDAIRALSTSRNPLFLRNRRGDFLKVAISGEIVTETEDKSIKQQITATIPWVEIGPVDGSVVKIISGGDSE